VADAYADAEIRAQRWPEASSSTRTGTTLAFGAAAGEREQRQQRGAEDHDYDVRFHCPSMIDGAAKRYVFGVQLAVSAADRQMALRV